MFVPDEKLKELTGLERKGAQCRRLVEHGWKFETADSGHPRVLTKYLEKRMGYTETTQVSVEKVEPRFEALQ